MEKEFVTYDIALKLKQIGFDLTCFAFFVIKENGTVEEHFLPANAVENEFGDLNQNNIANMVSRPLWQQMFRWLKEKYNFFDLIYKKNDDTWHWSLKINNSTPTADSFGNATSELEALKAFVDRVVFKIENPTALDETVEERCLRLMSECLESPEADKYFENLHFVQEVKESRFKKFEKYLETNSFDEILKRLMDENGDARRDYCYSKGCQTYPTNNMQFVLDFVSSRGEEQELGSVDDNMFESELFLYKGYYFQLSQGQGCFWRIFNSKKEAILTI